MIKQWIRYLGVKETVIHVYFWYHRLCVKERSVPKPTRERNNKIKGLSVGK